MFLNRRLAGRVPVCLCLCFFGALIPLSAERNRDQVEEAGDVLIEKSPFVTDGINDVLARRGGSSKARNGSRGATRIRSSANRSGRVRYGTRNRSYGYYYRPRAYYRPSYYLGFGSLGYYYPWHLWDYHYGGYYGRYRPGVYVNYRGDTGAIDLNVTPKAAQVYLDGHLIGKSGKFDGWPGYLRLRPGTYELVFYLEGHETVRKEYRVEPGVVLREHLTMTDGEAVAVEDISKPPPRKVMSKHTAAQTDHPRAMRRFDYQQPKRKKPPADLGEVETDLDLRGEPVRLRFRVFPDDASIYLNGNFIGTSLQLAQKKGDLILDPGEHLLEIVRPGRTTHKETIQVKQGETREIVVQLKTE